MPRLERGSVRAGGALLFCCGLLVSGCAREAVDSPDYALETIVNFGADGGSERFRRQGWSQTERVFTWAMGPRARLKFKLAPRNRPLGVRMRLASLHKAPELPFQSVELIANNVKVAEWQVAKMADFMAVIPPDVLAKQPALHLELRLPQATSPEALGFSSDRRPLGVSCFELQITNAFAIGDVWPQLAADEPASRR